ncbi:MAG: alternative ribosome rescue aminoacyl-tRNA hydrolase ArfB [Candidatus Magasanikbacteria bacterium]|nr:alternative ribosome rescue aminoacyl-tRNA hydrolase ArfB [Candidatus Magasanikbacteria bacterium]
MIKESELKINFVRSPGPGGQNVNKTSTKAMVRWGVGASRFFNNAEKARIRLKLANRLNSADEIIVTSSAERSQLQNKNKAILRLNFLISNALIIPKTRRATKPTRASRLKRLERKTKRSLVKRARRIILD